MRLGHKQTSKIASQLKGVVDTNILANIKHFKASLMRTMSRATSTEWNTSYMVIYEFNYLFILLFLCWGWNSERPTHAGQIVCH